MQNNSKNSPNFRNHKIEKENPMTSSQCQQGVCQLHCGLAIYIKKYLKAKEGL
jgi:hypothetical protein